MVVHPHKISNQYEEIIPQRGLEELDIPESTAEIPPQGLLAGQRNHPLDDVLQVPDAVVKHGVPLVVRVQIAEEDVR